MNANPKLNRRMFAGGAAAMALLPIAAPGLPVASRPLDAALLPALRFHAIVVDTGPMAAKGARAFADLMHRSLVPALAKTFADRMALGDARAPVLRVVIESAEFASDVGADGDPSSDNDYLEGAGLVTGGKSQVVAAYPILSALGVTNPSRSDSEAGHILRAQLLAEHFSYWLRRRIGV